MKTHRIGTKKILTMIMAALMVVQLLSLSALAVTTTPTGEASELTGLALSPSTLSEAPPMSYTVTVNRIKSLSIEIPDPYIPPTVYTLTYFGNGNTSGTVPAANSYASGAAVTVSDNTGLLVKTGYKFAGWNTKADGTGTSYSANSALTMSAANISLYAHWASNTLVYDDKVWGTAGENDYNVAYSTSDGKNTIVPTSYKAAIGDPYILYKTPKAGTYAAKYNFVGFTDVSGSDWASNFVWFLSARTVVNGIGKDLFDGQSNVTRAQFIKILTCLTPGIDPTTSSASNFKDVLATDWFSSYVNWGAENKIILGYDAEHFGPYDPITREQMSSMIARYSTYLGYDLGEINSAVTFSDQSKISSWAIDDVEALQKSGLITGQNNNMFNPQALSTRNEAATISCKFLMGILSAMDNPSKAT